MNKLTLSLVQIDNARSAFHGSWRYVLKADGRQLWQSNPGSREWAERNARVQFPGLEIA